MQTYVSICATTLITFGTTSIKVTRRELRTKAYFPVSPTTEGRLAPSPNRHSYFVPATLFQLRTGHCKLHLHLFRLGLHQDGLCDACHTPETVAHDLLVCPQYHAQRKILLASLRKISVNVNIADILRNPEASRHVQHLGEYNLIRPVCNRYER